ncbi:lanthionine synthetase LanC family protein [uncultured Cyclobacterium sp.]|uniref:lanthionine synthetase LanC family protein n=1 Tax=uncultured Cyclobacterium sp. TaxID=453820 RepID=UPI0030EB149A|tara:strand:+ start:5225 stop:7207 length:1983 start_codon:yes stop_codon:yes gene_type:complete
MDKALLYEKIISIADKITSQSIKSKDSTHFLTMKPLSHGNHIYSCDDSLYTGNAGILLFFDALYTYSGERRFLQMSKSIGNWLIQNKSEAPIPSFYLGESGIAYSLLMLYKQCGDEKYLISGLEKLKKCTETYPNSIPAEFFNGLSGVILVLLCFHQISGEAWLLERVDKAIEIILQRAHLSKEGICWDRNFDQIHGLCGLSHGASGIAYALWTVGEYTGNHNFYWLAKEAVRYENNYFNQKEQNWPDFRTSISDSSIQSQWIQAFKEGNESIFTAPTFFNGWCNGAVGIGLARLKGYQLTKDPELLQDAKNAARKTVQTDVSEDNPFGSYTLCHGGCGNAELFLEYARTTGDKTYFKHACYVAEKAIAQHKEQGLLRCGYGGHSAEDISLFMGTAGIGHHFLRLLDGKKVGSVLLPQISGQKWLSKDKGFNYLNLSLSALKKNLLKKSFPKSIDSMLFSSLPSSTDPNSNIDQTLKEMEHKLLDSTASNNHLEEIFKIEWAKVQIDWKSTSDVLSYIKSKVVQERTENILLFESEKLTETMLILNPDLEYNRTNEHAQNESGSYLVHRPAFNGVIVIELDELRFEICQQFQNATSIRAAFDVFLASYDTANLPNITSTYQLYIQNVVAAMKEQIIIPADIAPYFQKHKDRIPNNPSEVL